MKMRKKKWIASLCLIAMLLSFLPAAAFAEEDTELSFTEVPSPATDTYVAETPTIDVNIIKVDTPSASPVETYTPPVNTYTPSVDTYTPSVDTYTPSVDTYTPSVDTYTPSVDTYTPSVDTYTPPVDTASTSVDTASTSADTASTSADTASTSADTASTSAEAPAVTSETPVSDSVTDNSDSVGDNTSSDVQPQESSSNPDEQSSVTEAGDSQQQTEEAPVQLLRAPMMKSAAPALMAASPDAVVEDSQDDAPSEEPDSVVKTSTGMIIERKDQSDEVSTRYTDPENTDSYPMSLEDNYQLFVTDEGVYELTFIIDENADKETLTLDLTEALNGLQAYAGITGSNTFEPGDSRVFHITIKSESGHTYKYLEKSFVLTTPEADPDNLPDEASQVEGFDEQILDRTHMGDTSFTPSFWMEPFQKLLEEQGLDAFDRRNPPSYAQTQMKNDLKKAYDTEDLTEAVKAYLTDYYSEKDGVNYADYEEMIEASELARKEIIDGAKNTAGNRPISGVSLPLDASERWNYFYSDIFRAVYGEDDVNEATGEKTGVTSTTKTIFTVTDHDDGNVYSDCYPANEMGSSVVRIMTRYGLPENTLVCFNDKGGIIFGFANEDGTIATADNYDGTSKTITTTEAAYRNPEWHRAENTDIADATVAEYMKGADSDVWNKADAYFSQLLSDGISAEKASGMTSDLVDFMMAVNVDGELAGNEYQNTEWGWKNTIDLERVDGDFSLEKVDELGNTITDAETTFQLWYYKETVDSEQRDKYYYTLIKTEKEDGTVTETPGFVKYEENSGLTYTIDTTRGKLEINNKMLEGIVYYLQEVAAPEGYALDATVYIICDNEETAKEAEQLLKDITASESSDGEAAAAEINTRYAGAINSEKPLEIKIVNASIPNPPPPGPGPDPDPVPPTPPTPPVTPTEPVPVVPAAFFTPEEGGANQQPGLLEIDDFATPLAGGLNMNEGDCFN